MRVVLLVDDYVPSPRAGARLIFDLASAFRGSGHQAFVVTPCVGGKGKTMVSVEDGIVVLRIACPATKGVAAARRALSEMALAPLIWRRGKNILCTWKIDLILYYSPTIFFSPLVNNLKELWKCPAYMILRDIFPKWALDVGILKKGLIHGFLSRQEEKNYQCADLIFIQSFNDFTYFCKYQQKYLHKITVVYNWSGSSEGIKILDNNPSFNLSLDQKTVFIFGGNFGVANEMMNIMRLVARLKTFPDVHFLFVGDGAERPRMERFRAINTLSNMTIIAPVRHETYLAILHKADIGVVSLSRRLTTHNFPCKLVTYLAAAMPTLISTNRGNDIMQMIADGEAGLVSEAGDDEELYLNALRLAQDSALRKRLGRNAHALFRRAFTADQAVASIVDAYRAQTAAPPSQGSRASSHKDPVRE